MQVWECTKNPQNALQQRFVGFFVSNRYTAFYARSNKRWFHNIRRFSTAAPTCIKSCIQNSPLQRFLRVSLSQLSARLKNRATSFLRREKALLDTEYTIQTMPFLTTRFFFKWATRIFKWQPPFSHARYTTWKRRKQDGV